ncbi:mammalian cell entry protein [Mycolicibacterium insubricum]|uniref:Mammalian cell entry protein n=1 Tax=Mycolicibacterium insubricum TaxID=444597 RepID=A0A1X0DH64_9MYCO|nr:MlaD family protein [Mycolicibacterium insubricum]MCB9438803.1 MCE family protein [Mycolicibacterium sp.]MCV7083343.1 MCE family protein [Mycolicibacterium insubricum]ORA71180.1 mammalian cell entry protein [Mycolicibacterium insubricum]BBZ68757.1 mammalian cell entry protein [Mycolicibacterium insubricum]
MSGPVAARIKFGVFAVVMLMLTVALFAVFGRYQSGPTVGYTAVFTDASRLKAGDSVRVAGIRVGTVDDVTLTPEKTALVSFDADRAAVLTSGTKAVVRYLNLTGDRYLELVTAPGDTALLPAGAQIPADRTAPALDIDQLLGGLRPVTQGLRPEDVNALTQSLLQVLQGQSGALKSLLSHTSSFTTNLADNNDLVQSLIDNLNATIGVLNRNGEQFSGTIDRVQRLVSDISTDRNTVGEAITALESGTASLADLLTRAGPPLTGTIAELNRLASNLEGANDRLDAGLQKAPNNVRKLVRLGSYGSFFNYYLCGVAVRVTDLEGRTAMFPWIRQQTGRCSDN